MRLRDFQLYPAGGDDDPVKRVQSVALFPFYESIRLALKALRPMVEAPFVKLVIQLQPGSSTTPRFAHAFAYDSICHVDTEVGASFFDTPATLDSEQVRRAVEVSLAGTAKTLGWHSPVLEQLVQAAWRGASVCDAEIPRTRVVARGAEAAAYLVADPGISKIVLRARRNEVAREATVRIVHHPLWLEDDFPAARGRTRDDSYEIVDRRGGVLASMPLPPSARSSAERTAARRSSPALVKVSLPLDASEWHGSAAETLWAEPLGGDQFRLQNSPFFAFGVSHEDVVLAELVDGRLEFKTVVARSGRSTYRLWLRNPDVTTSPFVAAWTPLEQLGCSYEGGLVFSVDVPASADIHAVYALLQAGEAAVVWDFEEGHCGHLIGEPSAEGKAFPDDDERMALQRP